MHVLLDARVDRGGVGRYATMLLAGLTELPDGPRCTVVRGDGDGLSRLATRPYTPWARGHVARLVRTAGADLEHGLCVELPRVAVARVATVHDLVPLEIPASMPSPLRRAEYRRVVASTMRRADAIVVPSTRTADALCRRMSVEPRRVTVIPYSLDPVFRPADAAEQEVARLRFAGGRPYVAIVTAARAHKNLDVVRFVVELLARRGDVAIVVRGPGVIASRHVRTVARLADDDLRLWYAGAAVFLAPSVVEGYGLPAVEAAGCGAPVVCGPGLGARDVLRDAVTVVDVTDAHAVARRIAAVLEDPALAGRLAAAGPAATAALTPRAMAAAHHELYREVLGG